MKRPVKKHLVYRKWIFCVLAAVLLAVISLTCLWRRQETEYKIIQAVIEDLPAYEEEIESWGYQVSVLPRLKQEPEDDGLLRYYWKSVGPVLVLTDPEGGRYCFYYGFDQYTEELVEPGTVQILHPQKETVDAQRTVRLQIYKRDMNSAPLLKNTAEPGSGGYYDMTVRLYIRADSPDSGEELMTYTNGYYETNYCSNNFVDCKWFSGITPEDASRYSDDMIKQEYSAGQLLELYRQGLKLQEQLAGLLDTAACQGDGHSSVNGFEG